MSKRQGDYITVEDLINEVGKDSTRFIMLNRSNDVELDFDFKKVTEKSWYFVLMYNPMLTGTVEIQNIVKPKEKKLILQKKLNSKSNLFLNFYNPSKGKIEQ